MASLLTESSISSSFFQHKLEKKAKARSHAEEVVGEGQWQLCSQQGREEQAQEAQAEEKQGWAGLWRQQGMSFPKEQLPVLLPRRVRPPAQPLPPPLYLPNSHGISALHRETPQMREAWPLLCFLKYPVVSVSQQLMRKILYVRRTKGKETQFPNKCL